MTTFQSKAYDWKRMKPHPSFVDWNIPIEHRLGLVVLKALTTKDLDRDYTAVMQSAAEIRAANPNSNWPPDGLTREQNLIDLAWHQKEFEARRSFAWVIEDEKGAYAGCAYVSPSINGEKTADVVWWWRTGASVERQHFRNLFLEWLAGTDWPSLEYRAVEMW